MDSNRILSVDATGTIDLAQRKYLAPQEEKAPSTSDEDEEAEKEKTKTKRTPTAKAATQEAVASSAGKPEARTSSLTTGPDIPCRQAASTSRN